jgi:peroxiredoxin
MRTRQQAGAAGAALALVLGVVWPVAAAPVPRKAAELTFVEPSGKQTPLSSFHGKVVVVEFLLTRCPHCWRVAQTLAKLDQELGPRGFQPIGIAFDSEVTGQAVADFAGLARVTYPVGYTTAAKVDGFLGREEQQRFQVPQLVVIDRAGGIRAQSRPSGEVNLEDEATLRRLIVELLQQPAP